MLKILLKIAVIVLGAGFFSFEGKGQPPHIPETEQKSSLRKRAESGQAKKRVKGAKQDIYHLTLSYKKVNFTGKEKQAMVINDSLPAPVLYFKEGNQAVIHVTNKMDRESSIHWHGILLPNFQDGVPYLTTPPIPPGKTHTFTFPLRHSGTYWYHSHTGLQEQRGLYGAIVIEPQPKKKRWKYKKDLVLTLSDWTDENPKEVLRTLKRGSEWYSIKKQTTQSLYRVIKQRALGAQFQLWKQRMPGMDISDVYYPAFLINGKRKQTYPQFKEGERVRLRIINAGASTYFQLSFGVKVLLISADGVDVSPTPTAKILHAIGETYDFLLTLPKGKSVEVRATAQDGSGFSSAVIGTGALLKAPVPPRPDLIRQMKDMAGHHGSHGHNRSGAIEGDAGSARNKHHHGSHGHRSGESSKDSTLRKTASEKTHRHGDAKAGPSPELSQGTGKNRAQGKNPVTGQTAEDSPMNPNRAVHDGGGAGHGSSHHTSHFHGSAKKRDSERKSDGHNENPPAHKARKDGKDKTADHGERRHAIPKSAGDRSAPSSSYDHLRALEKTDFPKNLPARDIHLNLTGNMRRYVWSMNGKTLSESDTIKINQNEVVRLILHNKTMMHHPMHLHGHFFRVLNKQGEYAPLKHTVDVPPMEQVTLEFAPNEKGDWFFHCHVLYHMKGGMARVFRRGDKRDPRLKDHPLSRVWNGDRQWYPWGEADIMTNRADLRLEMSNTRNRIRFSGTLSWMDDFYRPRKNYELEADYARFLTDIFRVYGGVTAHNSKEGWGSVYEGDVAGRVGFRYLLPYLVELDVSVDHKKRLEVELEYELLLLSRLEFFVDGSWVENFSEEIGSDERREWEWSLGLDYTMSKSLSLKFSYDNHFGWGGGINLRF